MSWRETFEKWGNYDTLENRLKQELVQMTDVQKEDAFYTNLEFGTGGMRGILGAGTNRMNVYTIRKANQGFATYIKTLGEDALSRGVAIAYDNRHMSREFALESARVMASNGIKAYVYDELKPTPQLSFTVRELNCVGGIMVTASHNPPEYNGYKIYDETGCQLVPEFADQVIGYVNEITDELAIEVKPLDELIAAGLVVEIGEELDVLFDEQVKSIQLNPGVNKSTLKIVFTPEHGTALKSVERILTSLGYDLIIVEEQATADPDFSGTKSANPEDTAAFEKAIEYGHKHHADLLIATDPDADRLGVAVLVGGEYELLTGNQTGALLIDYILRNRKQKGLLPENGIVFNTIVTSDFGAVIARDHGMSVESTLTGFKFIGDRIHHYENQGTKEFVFGYEESYGYLIKDYARDKDAIGAVLMACEMAAFYKNEGLSLYDQLLSLYEAYGYYREDLVAISLKGKDGKEKIASIMSNLRKDSIEEVAGVSIVAFEDYSLQKRFEADYVTDLSLPKSNVLKFFLEDGSWFAARPSGTEPKIKFYIGVKGDSLENAVEKNDALKKAVLDLVGISEV